MCSGNEGTTEVWRHGEDHLLRGRVTPEGDLRDGRPLPAVSWLAQGPRHHEEHHQLLHQGPGPRLTRQLLRRLRSGYSLFLPRSPTSSQSPSLPPSSHFYAASNTSTVFSSSFPLSLSPISSLPPSLPFSLPPSPISPSPFLSLHPFPSLSILLFPFLPPSLFLSLPLINCASLPSSLSPSSIFHPPSLPPSGFQDACVQLIPLPPAMSPWVLEVYPSGGMSPVSSRGLP